MIQNAPGIALLIFPLRVIRRMHMVQIKAVIELPKSLEMDTDFGCSRLPVVNDQPP
jgi:hypothetical protein